MKRASAFDAEGPWLNSLDIYKQVWNPREQSPVFVDNSEVDQ